VVLDASQRRMVIDGVVANLKEYDVEPIRLNRCGKSLHLL